MKLPSLASLGTGLIATFRRFPLAIAATMIAADYLIRMNHLLSPWEAGPTYHYYWNIIMSCYLGVLLFTAITLYVERKDFSLPVSILFNTIGIALIVCYYYMLPDSFATISTLRFFLFALALHFLIAFVPYIGEDSSNGFWQYNKILFIRILTAALYTGVLYAGLALAILAVHELFKVHINDKLYMDLWILLSTVFNTWFFIAGLPTDFNALESSTDYPKGLKIFTQYVLIPLISIYLLILYAYMFKIIFTAQWPVGWVSYLVLGFSIAGILSLLLIYPVRNDENNKWIIIFSRFFYFALFPLILLLFFAIARRIHDYGITEDRYFILALALWLVFIAAYFLLSKAKNIKTIPVTLCLIALLSSFGPWGAFKVSLHSQERRLVRLLQKNELLKDGKVIPSKKAIPFEERKQLSSTVEYIVDIHGYQFLQPYFSQNLDTVMKVAGADRYNRDPENILALMNIKQVYSYETADDNSASTYLDYTMENNSEAFDIAGYSYFIDSYEPNTNTSDSTCNAYTLANHSLSVCYTPEIRLLSVILSGSAPLTFDIGLFIKEVNQKHPTDYVSLKPAEMTLTASNDKLNVKLIVTNLTGTKTQDSIAIGHIATELLIGIK